MEQLANKNIRGYNCFDDGIRRVDFILVFNKPNNANKAEDNYAAEARRVFEVQLIININILNRNY